MIEKILVKKAIKGDEEAFLALIMKKHYIEQLFHIKKMKGMHWKL